MKKKNCIDLVKLSSDLGEDYELLEINESLNHVLKRITNTKNGAIIK